MVRSTAVTPQTYLKTFALWISRGTRTSRFRVASGLFDMIWPPTTPSMWHWRKCSTRRCWRATGDLLVRPAWRVAWSSSSRQRR